MTAAKQSKETCYAYAAASVLHLAMMRIVGREGGNLTLKEVRDDLIAAYGTKGEDTNKVLQEVCPKYRLHCTDLKGDIKKALKAVSKKRPVLARLQGTEAEFAYLRKYFDKQRRGIFTEKEFNDLLKKRPSGQKLIGHAVVLTSYNSTGLRFMNSWGSDWGDSGFFWVSSAKVFNMKFTDVYWTKIDLKLSELCAYKLEGPNIADNLMKKLKGLNTATYTCPLCEQESQVTEFTGKLVKACCPKCCGEFDTKEAGNDLALNMYLTSLMSTEQEEDPTEQGTEESSEMGFCSNPN